MFRSVLESRASEGQRAGSAQGLNRMGAGFGGGSGQFESIEGPRRCSGRCPGGPAQMREDLGDHGGSSMAAMIVKGPSHGGQCSRSISNTRLSSRAQLTGAGAAEGAPHRGQVNRHERLTDPLGMISGRSLALGASTPWKRIRCNRGAAVFEATDPASEKILYIYRLLVHDSFFYSFKHS